MKKNITFVPINTLIMFAILFAIITSFIYPQEKVHVTTDREFYLSGDTVWMHSLLVDDIDTAIVHARSRYLYVELRDLRDSLLNRVKLRATLTRVPPRKQGDERNLTLFSGYMPLPPTIVSGDYTLVAYTYYMAGTTELGWFKKRLHILTPRDVAYGFVSRVVMEPDFIQARCDTVIDASQPAADMSLLSLSGLNERPQLGVYSNLAEKSLDGELLEHQGVVDLAGAIQKFSGVMITNNAIVWRRLYVALFFDGIPEAELPAYEGDDYGFSYPTSLNMPISSIARIDFMNENGASMISNRNGLQGQPVVAVTMRMGASRSDMNISHCTIHQPLGHQPMSRFTANSSTLTFVAELGMFLDDAESKWQQVLRTLTCGS